MFVETKEVVGVVGVIGVVGIGSGASSFLQLTKTRENSKKKSNLTSFILKLKDSNGFRSSSGFHIIGPWI
jgi:hypothetical protein